MVRCLLNGIKIDHYDNCEIFDLFFYYKNFKFHFNKRFDVEIIYINGYPTFYKSDVEIIYIKGYPTFYKSVL